MQKYYFIDMILHLYLLGFVIYRLYKYNSNAIVYQVFLFH